jgi:adenosylcobinamide-GDP ribazoletransferase
VSPVLRGARAAFVFLTRVPVGGHPYTPVEWAWSAAHFPLVGVVVGGILAVVHRALAPLGLLADSVFVVAESLLLTGALHEDGLADTFDALGGAPDRERIFEILKDSRVGAFGACALLVSFAGRVALLERLGADAEWALPLALCGARVGPVWQIAALPYVSRTGAKSTDVMQARSPQALLATVWLAVVAVVVAANHLVSGERLAVMALVLAAITAASGWIYARRAGGVTGDFLGATEQIGELAALAVLAWAVE